LRSKLGSALPLVTMRGAGYKLSTGDEDPDPMSETPPAVTES
jgi:hypothetical protein